MRSWKLWAAAMVLAGGVGCRPDPYSLLVRAIRPGEEVALPGGMTLVAEERDGTVLSGVTVRGPAQTCEGTMTLVAPEVRLERGGEAGGGVRLVLVHPVAEERCGSATATTKHDRLTLYLDGL
jgi:hypothetical protein